MVRSLCQSGISEGALQDARCPRTFPRVFVVSFKYCLSVLPEQVLALQNGEKILVLTGEQLVKG